MAMPPGYRGRLYSPEWEREDLASGYRDPGPSYAYGVEEMHPLLARALIDRMGREEAASGYAMPQEGEQGPQGQQAPAMPYEGDGGYGGAGAMPREDEGGPAPFAMPAAEPGRGYEPESLPAPDAQASGYSPGLARNGMGGASYVIPPTVQHHGQTVLADNDGNPVTLSDGTPVTFDQYARAQKDADYREQQRQRPQNPAAYNSGLRWGQGYGAAGAWSGDLHPDAAHAAVADRYQYLASEMQAILSDQNLTAGHRSAALAHVYQQMGHLTQLAQQHASGQGSTRTTTSPQGKKRLAALDDAEAALRDAHAAGELDDHTLQVGLGELAKRRAAAGSMTAPADTFDMRQHVRDRTYTDPASGITWYTKANGDLQHVLPQKAAAEKAGKAQSFQDLDWEKRAKFHLHLQDEYGLSPEQARQWTDDFDRRGRQGQGVGQGGGAGVGNLGDPRLGDRAAQQPYSRYLTNRDGTPATYGQAAASALDLPYEPSTEYLGMPRQGAPAPAPAPLPPLVSKQERAAQQKALADTAKAGDKERHDLLVAEQKHHDWYVGHDQAITKEMWDRNKLGPQIGEDKNRHENPAYIAAEHVPGAITNRKKELGLAPDLQTHMQDFYQQRGLRVPDKWLNKNVPDAPAKAKDAFFNEQLPKVYDSIRERKDAAAGFAVANMEAIMKRHPGDLSSMAAGDRWQVLQGLKYAKKHGLQVDLPGDDEAGAVRPDESLFGPAPK